MSRDEEARSTDRPPAPEDEAARDLAAAIRAAKTSGSPGRYAAPAATAKIKPFELAQALALSSGDHEHPPGSSRPPREDDAPFVGGEVEVVGEEEIPSGVPSTSPSRAPSHAPSHVRERDVVPAPRSYLGVAILGALLGLAVIAYVWMRTR